MEKYTTELNPLSFDNLTMFLTISVTMGTLIVLVIVTDNVIIPKLNPDNKFRKWWEKHMINFNPYEKN